MLKLINILKNTIAEQAPIGLYTNYGKPSDYYVDVSTGEAKKRVTQKTYSIDSLWSLFCNKIIDRIEGGYFNSDCGHPSVREEANTETMFGIDRFAGNWDNTSAGREFFGIIDKEKIERGAKLKNGKWKKMEKFCGVWKWLYRGGELNSELKNKSCSLMYNVMTTNMSNFTEKAKSIVQSDKRLLFHFSYACWNGSGNFKRWALEFNKVAEQNKTIDELVDFCVEQRNKWTSNMSDQMKDANQRVVNIIKNDPDLKSDLS
jgi:hypothetical protein